MPCPLRLLVQLWSSRYRPDRMLEMGQARFPDPVCPLPSAQPAPHSPTHTHIGHGVPPAHRRLQAISVTVNGYSCSRLQLSRLQHPGTAASCCSPRQQSHRSLLSSGLGLRSAAAFPFT